MDEKYKGWKLKFTRYATVKFLYGFVQEVLRNTQILEAASELAPEK